MKNLKAHSDLLRHFKNQFCKLSGNNFQQLLVKACDFFFYDFSFKKVKHVQEIKKEHEEIELVC